MIVGAEGSFPVDIGGVEEEGGGEEEFGVEVWDMRNRDSLGEAGGRKESEGENVFTGAAGKGVEMRKNEDDTSGVSGEAGCDKQSEVNVSEGDKVCATTLEPESPQEWGTAVMDIAGADFGLLGMSQEERTEEAQGEDADLELAGWGWMGMYLRKEEFLPQPEQVSPLTTVNKVMGTCEESLGVSVSAGEGSAINVAESFGGDRNDEAITNEALSEVGFDTEDLGSVVLGATESLCSNEVEEQCLGIDVLDVAGADFGLLSTIQDGALDSRGGGGVDNTFSG
ncbi:unnamed protein product, partial [Choristocarpus tenellus]